MTPLDRLLQRIRVRKAIPHFPAGARVLDVGCADAYLIRTLGPRIAGGTGIDPDAVPAETDGVRIVRGRFPDDLHDAGPFDAIAMLAVFEHIREAERPRVVEACRRLLRPGGRLVLTVPAPAVDRIVGMLRALRLADGLDLEGHHGFRPEQTPASFAGFRLLRHERFELGLNHLFVFER